MKEKFRSIFFAFIIIVIAISNIVKPDKLFSKKENRYLKEFPEINKEVILSGKFGEEFEEYTSDQFILRDKWITVKTITDLGMLKKDNGRVYFGKKDYLFEIDNKIDEKQFDKNIEAINSFSYNINQLDKDISVSALLVPSKSEVLKDKLPEFAPIISEKNLFKKLDKILSEKINVINPIADFYDKSDDYIYYKTDHHWTSKGAYYGYKFFMENKNETPLGKDQFRIKSVTNDFLGTTYRKANYYKGLPDTIDEYSYKDKIEYGIIVNQKEKVNSLYDESYLNETDKYSYFLGGNKAILEINTSEKNGKSILIIKDSFANSFIPFLLSHYENIVVIDTRYFNKSIKEYIREKEINEILFLFNIKNFVNEKSIQILNK